MRLLVYTCVFGGYDRIFPPIFLDRAFDYIAITDDPQLKVHGWRPHLVDTSAFGSARSANRYYKMLGHRILPGYEASIYVDGNIRLLGQLQHLISDFQKTGAALGAFPHPTRKDIAGEAEACVASGKVDDAARLRLELECYLADGFTDKQGLIEATVLLKNHSHPALDAAMELWWALFERYESRDQISLPYVIWKTALPVARMPNSFRVANPYFGIYPHFAAANVSSRYAYACARSYDSVWYRLLLAAWHTKWRVQRLARSLRGALR